MIRAFLKQKKSIRSLVLIFCFLSCAFILRYGFTPKKAKDISEYTISVQEGTLPGTISASGEIQAVKTVNVSPKKQGLLEQIYVKEGDKVMKGDLIAKMETGDLKFRLNELKAEYANQKSNYERRKILFKEGAISAEVHDDFKNKFLTSKARLNQAELEKDDLNIKAPFSGLITAEYAVIGSFVRPTSSSSFSNSQSNNSSSQSSIVELSQGLEIIAKVPESDIGRIKIGQEATIRVDAFPEKRFEAKVNEISPRAIKSNNVTSFEVTLLLLNSPKELRIGMNSDIEFKTGKTNLTTLVPTVAIVTEKGEPGLLIVDKTNKPKFKRVELGISSGSKTSILNGISPGEKIFIDIPPWSKKYRN